MSAKGTLPTSKRFAGIALTYSGVAGVAISLIAAADPLAEELNWARVAVVIVTSICAIWIGLVLALPSSLGWSWRGEAPMMNGSGAVRVALATVLIGAGVWSLWIGLYGAWATYVFRSLLPFTAWDRSIPAKIVIVIANALCALWTGIVLLRAKGLRTGRG